MVERGPGYYEQLNFGLVPEKIDSEVGSNFGVRFGDKSIWLRNNTELGMLRTLEGKRGESVPIAELAAQSRRGIELNSVAPYISHIRTALGEEPRHARFILKTDTGYVLITEAPEIDF